jgi:WG containing repeat
MKNLVLPYFLLLLFSAMPIYAQEPELTDVFTGDYKGTVSYLINRKINYNPAQPEQEYGDYQKEYDYFVAKQKGKYGIYNQSKKEWFAPAVYDSINFLGNALRNGKWQNILYSNEVAPLLPEGYQGIITVKNGKYGLKDIAGNTILEPKYDEIRANESSLNIYFYRKGNKWGFASTVKDGFVVKPDYDYAVISTDFDTQSTAIKVYRDKKVKSFSTWKAPKGSKKMLKPAPEPVWHFTAFDSSYCYDHYKPKGIFYTEGDKNGIKDSVGTIIVPAKYNRIMPLLNGNYIVNKDSLYGLVNATGNFIIPLQYTNIHPADGRPPYNSLYKVYKHKPMAFFGPDGKQLTPFEFLGSENLYGGYSNLWEGTYILAKEEKIVEPKSDTTYNDIYSKSVLLYKNNQIAKVLQGCTQTGYANEKILFYNKPGSPLYGFLSLTTLNKTEPLYNTKYTLMDNGKLWVRKGMENVVITTAAEEEPLHKNVFYYANGYFIYKEDGRMGAMDSKYTPLPFTYPKLEPLVRLPKYTSIDTQLVEQYSGLFRYYDEAGKPGVVDANGTILFPAGQYDEVTLALSIGNYAENFYRKKEAIKEYLYKIFVCKKNNGSDCDITLYLNGKAIAHFTTYASWNLTYNDISKSGCLVSEYKGTTRFIDLKSGKTNVITLPVNGKSFNEDEDGGYTVYCYYDTSGKLSNKAIKYTPSGEALSENVVRYNGGNLRNYTHPQYISEKNGKYGLADVYGREVMPYINDTLSTADDVIYAARRGNRYGIITKKDSVVQTFDFEKITIFFPEHLSGNNKIYFSLKRNGQSGLANASGKIILPPVYTTIDIKTFIFAEKEGVISVYSAEGKLLFSIECNSISNFTVNTFKYTKNGKQGIVGIDGKIVMQPLYDTINFVENDIYSVTDTGKTYIIDVGGNKLLPFPLKSAYLSHSTNNLYNTDAKHFVLQNELGKYAVYDIALKQLTPFEYDGSVKIEICRYILARKKGLYGVTGTDGKQVLPYIYEEIDFDENRHVFEASLKGTDYTISPEGVVLSEEKND